MHIWKKMLFLSWMLPSKLEDNYAQKNLRNSDRNKNRPPVSHKQNGWHIVDGFFSFPRTLSVTPFKNFSCEDKEYTYGRRCSLFHGRFPQNHKKTDRILIADWVKTTRNIKYSSLVDMTNLQRSLDETNDGEQHSHSTVTQNENEVELPSPQT